MKTRYDQIVNVADIATRNGKDLQEVLALAKQEDFKPATEDAKRVIDLVHEWQEKLYPEYGLHFIHCGYEWYILAGEDMPEEDTYDGYLQL